MAEARVEELLAELSSNVPRRKFGAAKALRFLSESEPHLLYPYFDEFVDLMRQENKVLRWDAMLTLGNLAPVDEQGRLDEMLDDYLLPIAGPRMIDAANAMRGATAIGAAKPHLADKIAARILRVEKSTYDRPECRNVALGHAIEAFACLYPLIAEQKPVQQFVARQLENSRPATRKKAERFLRRWPLGAQASAKSRAT